MTPALACQGSDTGLALGDDGANATSDVVPGERMALRVRFNPEVEIHEYEPDSNFNFMEVDDVIPPTEPLVVGGAVQHHFSTETEDVIPINSDAGVEDDQPEFELDVDDDAYVVLHGFGVLQASTATLPISPEEPLKVITYGIRGVSLGRRDTWVTVAELPHLKRVLWDLWQDAVPQHAACWAFAVRPQPLLELQVARAWILLVEIDPGEATPPGYCATLTLTCNEEGEMFARPLPRLVREDTTTEALILQHSHSHVCLPDGLRPCRLEVEGLLHPPQSAVHVRPGALLKLSIAHATPPFRHVQFWHPDAEQLAVDALEAQRFGLELFQIVLHMADHPPREYQVGITAFTDPVTLRQILPTEVRHSRLHWLRLGSLHPTMGVWRGRYHFVVGATMPGPTRPLMVVSCRATASYCEQWHHEVLWIPHGFALDDFIALVFSDLDAPERTGVVVCNNQAPITSLDGLGAGAVVTLYSGRSMSSEGLDVDPEDDETFLIGDFDPRDFSLHVVLQHTTPIWRGLGPAEDVFQRRTLYLLEQDHPAHKLFSWALLNHQLWRGEFREVDLLIQYPRPLGAVDMVVEFIDFRTQRLLQDPSVFRTLGPLTYWALCWSLQQTFHYASDWQVGAPMVNGFRWNNNFDLQRVFHDGDVITIFLQDGSNVNDVCEASSSPSSMTSSTQQDVELQVVTLFQTGNRGEDQRFDILVPWHQPLLATLQWCLANPLVGWVAPCISFRRHTWLHRKQVFAISWTDLADPHTVPVLII